MSTDYSDNELSNEPLVRFDLRGQFAMNRVIRQVKKKVATELWALGSKTVAPYLYNRRTRSFQSFAVHATAIDHLKDNEQESRLKSLRELLRDEEKIERSAWNDYWDAVEVKKPEDDKWLETYDKLEYVQWLNYYFRYCARQNELMNGLLWEVIGRSTKCSPCPVSALGGLLVRVDNESWAVNMTQTAHNEAFEVRTGSNQLLRLKHDLIQTRSGSRGDLKVHEELVKIFAFEGEQILSHILLIPIYDYYIDGVPWGGIAATLQIPLTFRNRGEFAEPSVDEKEYIARLVNKLQLSVEVITNNLASSAKQRAVTTPTGTPLSLTHEWIRGLQLLQDWEEILVERIGKVPLVWKRRPTDVRGIPEKDGLFSTLILNSDQDGCEKRPKDEPTDSSPVITFETTGKEHDAQRYVEKIEYAMRIDDRSERGRLANLQDIERITFRFPPHFRLPSDIPDSADKQWRDFCDLIVRQQKEMFQILEPKVLARKSAVRTAVSAIMGRNMSHNIGSHVLARYGADIGSHDYHKESNAIDPRTEFLAYLQRRMDFLAEVATADQAFWARSISLREAVSRLDIDEESRLYSSHENPPNCEKAVSRCILLNYITGKDLVASVKFENPTGGPSADEVFACPSGEVGLHALYVILENIIRNSARHAPSPSAGEDKETVAIYVLPRPDGSGPTLLKVELVDPRSRWTGSADGPEASYLATINQILNANGNGDKHISSNACLLDERGYVNPKNWGLREMQICAQFLRGLPLSDLEGEPGSPPLLKAVAHTLGGSNWCLAYEVWLQRAKDIAIVYPDCGDGDFKQQATALGVRVLSPAPSKGATYNWTSVIGQASNYAILAFPIGLANDFQQWINEDQPILHKHSMPMRCVGVDTDVLRKLALSDVNARASALALLHIAVARKYLWNGKAKKSWWKNNPFNVVYGVDAELPASTKNVCGGHLIFTTVHKNTLCDSGEISGTPDLAWMNDPLQQKSSANALGVAWLDHCSDEMLNMAGKDANFLYSGISPIYPDDDRSIWLSVESARSASVHRDILQRAQKQPSLDSSTIVDLAELVSSAAARVVVLDERIQSRRNEHVASVTLHRFWASAGIWCPRMRDDFLTDDKYDTDKAALSSHASSCACDLNQPNFDELRAFLCSPTRLEWQCPADVLVIHLTILERLKKEGNRSEGEVLRELVDQTSCADAQLVIVTGRGVPAAAWQRDGGIDARYLPISAIQEYLVSRPSKLGLMRVLWAARKPS